MERFFDFLFWNKLSKCATSMGAKAVYYVLLLYFLAKAKDVPILVKVAVVGALSYLILPLDVILNFIPAKDFTDYLSALSFAFKTSKAYITKDIEQQAKAKVEDIFGTIDFNHPTT